MSDAAETSVPVLEISRDWTVDDLKTTADCDDAFDVLTEAIASIEGQISAANIRAAADGVYADRGWLLRAKFALRHKKAAIQRVQQIRARIAKAERMTANVNQERVLLDIIKATEPEAFKRALEVQRRLDQANGAAP